MRWIEDASNASFDFDRNYLRWRIMPLRNVTGGKPYFGPFGPDGAPKPLMGWMPKLTPI